MNLFSLLVFIGVAVQLSAWASGPAKTVTESARKVRIHQNSILEDESI